MAQRIPPRAPSSRDRQPRTFRLTINALLTLPVCIGIFVTHYRLLTLSSKVSSLQSPSCRRQGSLVHRSVYLDLQSRRDQMLRVTDTVTPMFKVKLDDVLNRKHLPPLGSYRSLLSSHYRD
jgi:hypothetical protein